jgi:hypothetical protein
LPRFDRRFREINHTSRGGISADGLSRRSRRCNVMSEINEETRLGVKHPTGVWFDEPVKELSIRAEKYDLNYTLLHLGNDIQHVCS